MLDEQQLGEYIDARFTRSLFRLETHDHLDVPSDREDMRKYLAGEPGPGPRPWLDVIRDEVSRGLHTYRVHVVRSPLTDYLRYVCEWGYRLNVEAGEHVAILDLAERDAPRELVWTDYWLIDDQHVVLMSYDERGRFVGAAPIDQSETERYRVSARAAWAAAQSFTDYYESHRQFWRDASTHAA